MTNKKKLVIQFIWEIFARTIDEKHKIKIVFAGGVEQKKIGIVERWVKMQNTSKAHKTCEFVGAAVR